MYRVNQTGESLENKMLVSARVDVAKLAVLAKHFERLGIRVKTKSQLINMIVEGLTKYLIQEGALLDSTMTTQKAVDFFVRLGFEPPELSKAEKEEMETAGLTQSLTEYVADAIEAIGHDLP